MYVYDNIRDIVAIVTYLYLLAFIVLKHVLRMGYTNREKKKKWLVRTSSVLQL